MGSAANQKVGYPVHTSSEASKGFVGIVLAQVTWGLQPLFWLHLVDVPALEAITHRVLWSFLFAAVMAVLLGDRIKIRELIREGRSLRTSAMCGLLMLTNWSLYVYAIWSGQLVEAALSLFLIPLTTVFVGVIFLRERLRPAQWVSICLGIIAIAVIVVGYGSIPWLALGQSSAVAFYSLFKKQLGYPPMTGMAVENILPCVAALSLVVYLEFNGTASFGSSTSESILLVCTGIITTVPLALFAYALRRIRLTLAGVTQYLNATLQFLIAVFVVHETVGTARWIGFILVWIALAIFTVDNIHYSRRARRTKLLSQ